MTVRTVHQAAARTLRSVLWPLLLPVQFALLLFTFRLGRLRAARARGDRGAISIELALAIIALVFVAGAVAAALYLLKDKVVKKVEQDPNMPGGGGAAAGGAAGGAKS
ncbi:hypothetical protein [Streptomyces sp. NRRL WC-3742]|uniref:hypothetical protein n=1 Tax=Streptomyces sp. NRRL WC-3742 TaxID=1463934 RepID=UPI00055E7E85|nr:hypothetical protein [Streptomyces sp. NRRL WC-3742]